MVRFMTMILLSACVWAAWYAAASLCVRGSVPVRVVLAGLGASGQIVLTSMVLGLVGGVTPVWLAGASGAVCLVLVGCALWFAARSRDFRNYPLAGGGADLQRSRVGLRAALGWETLAGGCVFAFAYAWLASAAYHYPPRGVDDLVYHLPPVYQAVQDHRFEILPLALRKFFAFPFSAEMPFLWIASLTRSVHWVGAGQIPFALLATVAVFALGRRYRLSVRSAALAALSFATMPVLFLQAGSNYVDVIVNAWVLAGAVALLEYERGGRWLALALGALAAGLVMGSKYQAIPFAGALAGTALVLIVKVESSRWRRGAAAALVSAIVLASGSYWYVRNWIQFGNPFYPLPIRVLGMELFPGDWPQNASIWSALVSDPAELLRIALKDPGLGTYNGGFGFLVWGFAVPGLLYLALRLRAREGDVSRGRLLVLGLVPVGVAAWFVSPFEDLTLTARYVLSIGGFALVGFAHLIDRAGERRFGGATCLRAMGVLAAVLPLGLAAAARQPLLSLAPAANEAPETRGLSSLRYLRYTLRDLGQMSRCWAPLDEMTRAGGGGLSVFQAADFQVFWTAPTYGSELQNRIWQFAPSLDHEPDAYFFHTPRNRGLYLVKDIRRETVAADPRYELVAGDGDDATTLYVLRTALGERGRSHRLADYYRRLDAALVAATANSAAQFEPASVVVAPFPLAEAYLVHKDSGLLRAELEPVTSKDVESHARLRPRNVLYTFGAPLPDRPSRPAGELALEGRTIPVYRNEPMTEAGSVAR